MKLLLHICCGPCTTYPLEDLRKQGIEPLGYFYNPNIHPYLEFQRRLETLETFAENAKLSVHYQREYEPENFLQAVAFREEARCQFCYQLRLEQAALAAKNLGCTHLTTTLLVSPYQNRELICQIGQEAAHRHGIEFSSFDWRGGFRAGQRKAAELGLYRQPYCGCIYSEAERYLPARRRKSK